jgi:hypothetical protein
METERLTTQVNPLLLTSEFLAATLSKDLYKNEMLIKEAFDIFDKVSG